MKKFPVLCINHIAAGAIPSYRIVKGTAAEATVALAVTDTDKFVGVSGIVSADAAGDRIDIEMLGIAPVQYGGTVAFGDLLTSDATGRAIIAIAGDRVIGVAQEAGVIDEIGSLLLNHSFGLT